MRLKIITAFIMFSIVNLYAEAVNSGSTVSIDSNSSFNALRNPALMSFQQSENTSIMYQYSSLVNSESDIYVRFGVTEGVAGITMNESYNGALFFSNVFFSGNSAYGIGVSKTGEGQVQLNTTERSVQLGSYFSMTTEEKRYIGSTFLLSYSYRLNNKESLGLQVETLAFQDSREHNQQGTDLSEFKTDKFRLTTGGTLGYYHFDNNYEFGAMLKSGQYGIENQNKELYENGISSKKKISNYYMNNEGLGAILGFGVKPSRKYLVSFEAGYSIPLKYKEKKFDDDDVVEEVYKKNMVYSFGARGGVTYFYSRYLSIGFGGNYIIYKDYTSDEDGVQIGSNKYKIYQVTTGIDVKPSKNYTLLFGLDYKKGIAGLKEEKTSSSFKLDLEQDYLDIMAGLSYNYN